MEFLLESESGSFVFLVEDLSDLRFEINDDKTHYLQEPCPVLNGLKVMVVYADLRDKVYDGAVREILVLGTAPISR
jgi:hypothetical protein